MEQQQPGKSELNFAPRIIVVGYPGRITQREDNEFKNCDFDSAVCAAYNYPTESDPSLTCERFFHDFEAYRLLLEKHQKAEEKIEEKRILIAFYHFFRYDRTAVKSNDRLRKRHDDHDDRNHERGK